MTAIPIGRPPSGKPRGGPADNQTIELYQLIYMADHPLTIEEIADGMPSAFRNAAYTAHRAYLESVGASGMAEDPQAKAIAWRRWIEDLVRTGLETKLVIAKTASGQPTLARRRRDSDEVLVYVANSNKPPNIYRRREVDVVEAWSPEYATLGREHVARVQRRDEALAELTKAKKLLDKMPAKSAADRRQPVELTVAELRKLVEACEAQIRQTEH